MSFFGHLMATKELTGPKGSYLLLCFFILEFILFQGIFSFDLFPHIFVLKTFVNVLTCVYFHVFLLQFRPFSFSRVLALYPSQYLPSFLFQ